ncbi:MAG: hypothetical protein IT178_17915, partial [Acidobacteria bacterium]|nr:hypothetical protein [Acidobacteriota bacterium]
VGCSSGAELYSVAMLLAEAGRLHDATLVGVDCRPDAVSAARAGVFPDAAMTGIVPSRRQAYFDAVSGGWRVAYALRRHTTWVLHDVLQATPAGPWDLVLCRNVCIYLQSRSADALLRALVQDLRPGGALVLGKAEQPPRGLGLHERARGVYQV